MRQEGLAASRRWLWSAGVLCAASLLGTAPVTAVGVPVSFAAPGGRTVSAWLTAAERRPAPAVVLVPMLGQSRDGWQSTADRLAAAGIHALTIDLPGEVAPAEPQALQAWHQDVRAAVAFLAGRADVRPGALGVAGASLGANLAALAAAADTGIRSIALLSPSLDYRGVRIDAAMQQYAGRPALLVASVHDPYAARSVRELARDGAGSFEVRWSAEVGHGTALLAREPDLVQALVEWFQRTLG